MNLVKISKSKIINLDTVSSIGFKVTSDGDIKVIVNYSHSITLKNGIMVADYTYAYYSQPLKDVYEIFVNLLGENALISTDISHYLINGDKVSNIAFDNDKRRIIFNLNHSKEIQMNDGEYILTSDFCYWDYSTQDEYEKNVKALIRKSNKIIL